MTILSLPPNGGPSTMGCLQKPGKLIVSKKWVMHQQAISITRELETRMSLGRCL